MGSSVKVCTVCGWRSVVVKDRCRTWYEHRRRHGTDRTADLILSNLQRRNDGRQR